ncbi:odorant receptor 83a-like [Vespula squamosa]|uniref:Odorant receptor n=1 Tax=Vespula squamosa TaxID=30214 RepID=A0ABD2BED8_VESSQ
MDELTDSSKRNEANVTYVNDNEYSVRLIRWLLTSMGVWQSSMTKTSIEKLRSLILIILSFSLISFTFVPCTLYAFLEEKNLQARMEALGQVSYWLMGAIKYSYILFHRGNVRRCLDHIERDWRTVKRSKDRDIMLTHANSAHYFILICTSFTCGSVFIYNLVKGMTLVPVSMENHTVYLHPLPCPCYSKIADTRYNPTYKIIYGLQLFSGVITSSIVVCACSLATVFIMHACGQLAMMMAWMKDSFTIPSIESTRYQLSDIVGLHVRALSFIEYIENVINRICLVELLGCTLNMCLLGYFCITEWENNDTKNTVAYFLVFVSMMFNIFVFCFLSEKLSQQCLQVGDVAYACDWHLLPNCTARGFILIILRSNSVVRLTAGKFMQISIITFGDVIKTSAVYFNMLQKVT